MKEEEKKRDEQENQKERIELRKKKEKYEEKVKDLSTCETQDEKDSHVFEFSVLSNSAIDLVEIDFIDDLVDMS